MLPPDVRFKGYNAPNRFRLGLGPRPRRGSLQRSPDPLAGFKGPTFKGRGGRERKVKEGRGREGRGGKGRHGRRG